MESDTCILHAYFAGNFDGEGCVDVQKKRTGRYTIQLIVAGNYKPTIELYKATFGGNIYTQRAYTGKIVWRWVLADAQGCLEFITCVLPYSREKSAQLTLLAGYLQKYIADQSQKAHDVDSTDDLRAQIKKLKDFSFERTHDKESIDSNYSVSKNNGAYFADPNATRRMARRQTGTRTLRGRRKR